MKFIGKLTLRKAKEVTSLAFMSILASTVVIADDCEYQRDQTTQLALIGVVKVQVEAGAGELRILGEEGRTEVSIKADMCASDEDVLEGMNVDAKIDGSEAVIVTNIPKQSLLGWGNHQARINLTLLVPMNTVLDVKDSSGAALIKDVRELRITDSSGELEIERISGNVDVTDSSGALFLKKIKGTVEVTDSSGGIYASDVAEDLVIRMDSSGEIDAKRIGRNVLVVRDSSGAINVKNVGGDFTVERDSSGGINYKNVVGKVSIPD